MLAKKGARTHVNSKNLCPGGSLTDSDEQHGPHLCITCNCYKESILSREFCGKT